MKIVVFGATGGTGQHVVSQALAAGHTVVAFVRTPSKLTTTHANLQVVQGDVTDAEAVAGAVTSDVDAVLSALAPVNNQPTFLISKGMANIIAAMQAAGVDRLVITGGAGVPDPNDRPGVPDHIIRFLIGTFSKNVLEDVARSIDLARKSGLVWTAVRAPRLTDAPAKGTFQAGYVGDIATSLSRADFAAFMLQQLESDTWANKAPALSN